MYLVFTCMPGAVPLEEFRGCTLYLHAGQVRVTIGDSGLCCCICIMYISSDN